MSRRRTTSTAVVLASAALWVAWDVYAFLAGGGPDTLSAVFGRWFSYPWLGWWLAGAFGFLAGHLLGMTDPAAPGFWWRAAAVPLAAAAAGFALTLRS